MVVVIECWSFTALQNLRDYQHCSKRGIIAHVHCRVEAAKLLWLASHFEDQSRPAKDRQTDSHFAREHGPKIRRYTRVCFVEVLEIEKGCRWVSSDEYMPMP